MGIGLGARGVFRSFGIRASGQRCKKIWILGLGPRVFLGQRCKGIWILGSGSELGVKRCLEFVVKGVKGYEYWD